MRMMTAAATVVVLFCSAADARDQPQCSDRNALSDVSVDARLVAIKYYYDGFIRGLADPKRRACYEAQVLNDRRLAIVNKTLELIDDACLPVDRAARIAAAAACPPPAPAGAPSPGLAPAGKGHENRP